MRFTLLSSALVAATALFAGVAADEPTVATTTLTRTLQRVVQTVTSTRASGVATGTGAPYANATGYVSPTASAAPTNTGAATNLRFDAAGLVAVAGVIGYIAL